MGRKSSFCHPHPKLDHLCPVYCYLLSWRVPSMSDLESSNHSISKAIQRVSEGTKTKPSLLPSSTQSLCSLPLITKWKISCCINVSINGCEQKLTYALVCTLLVSHQCLCPFAHSQFSTVGVWSFQCNLISSKPPYAVGRCLNSLLQHPRSKVRDLPYFSPLPASSFIPQNVVACKDIQGIIPRTWEVCHFMW